MKLRDCNLGDIMLVCSQLRDDEYEQAHKLGYFGASLDTFVTRFQLMGGPKWAYVDEEASEAVALVVGGFAPIRDGVWASWFLASKRAWGLYPRQITEMAQERLQWALHNGAHRVETVCLSSRRLAQRWYLTTGLRHETTLKGACIDGSDAEMFIALKGEQHVHG